MKGVLTKVENTYYLSVSGVIVGTSNTMNMSASMRHPISKENCDAIMEGYKMDVEILNKDGYPILDLNECLILKKLL